MISVIKFGAFKATVRFDADISMYRGEFVELKGGADFYAPNLVELLKEGETILRILLEFAEEIGIDIRKSFPAH